MSTNLDIVRALATLELRLVEMRSEFLSGQYHNFKNGENHQSSIPSTTSNQPSTIVSSSLTSDPHPSISMKISEGLVEQLGIARADYEELCMRADYDRDIYMSEIESYKHKIMALEGECGTLRDENRSLYQRITELTDRACRAEAPLVAAMSYDECSKSVKSLSSVMIDYGISMTESQTSVSRALLDVHESLSHLSSASTDLRLVAHDDKLLLFSELKRSRELLTKTRDKAKQKKQSQNEIDEKLAYLESNVLKLRTENEILLKETLDLKKQNEINQKIIMNYKNEGRREVDNQRRNQQDDVAAPKRLQRYSHLTVQLRRRVSQILASWRADHHKLQQECQRLYRCLHSYQRTHVKDLPMGLVYDGITTDGHQEQDSERAIFSEGYWLQGLDPLDDDDVSVAAMRVGMGLLPLRHPLLSDTSSDIDQDTIDSMWRTMLNDKGAI